MELEADPSRAQPRRVCYEAAAHRGRVCNGRIRTVSATPWSESGQPPRAARHPTGGPPGVDGDGQARGSNARDWPVEEDHDDEMSD
jgi:hypothetical protein